jgi:hypothetical protein
MDTSNSAEYRERAARKNEHLTKLLDSGSITLATGGRACFNTNRLDCHNIETLVAAVKSVDPSFEKPEHGNWATITFTDGYVPGNGNKKSFRDRIAKVIDTYAQVNPEEHYGSYAVGEITADFEALGANLELAKKYGYGVLFVGDSNNHPDIANAHIKLANDGRKFKLYNHSFVKPFIGDEDSIRGVFKNKGAFVIYFPVDEIEKLDGVFQPVIGIVTISLSAYRTQSNELLDTRVDGVFVSKKCVEDPIAEIIHVLRRNGCSRYHNEFLEQFISTFNVDPATYIDVDYKFGGYNKVSDRKPRNANRGVDYAGEHNKAVQQSEDSIDQASEEDASSDEQPVIDDSSEADEAK